jgi:hypothetical protein
MPRVVPTQGMAYLLGRLPLPSAAAWRAAAAAAHAAQLSNERDQRCSLHPSAPRPSCTLSCTLSFAPY